MKLASLQSLHASMYALCPTADMQHFRLMLGAAEFDCLFSTRGNPFNLALTSRGESPEFFLFPISPTYEVTASFDRDTYARLASVLRTTGASGNKLIPMKFWSEVDALIPRKAEITRMPTAQQIIDLRRDIAEDRDKPYFSHWRNPGLKRDGTPAKVTAGNRIKTLEMLGVDALAHSDQNNISSSWSPISVKKGWRPENKK